MPAPLLHLLMSSVAEPSSFYTAMNIARTHRPFISANFDPPGLIFVLDQIFLVIGLSLLP